MTIEPSFMWQVVVGLFTLAGAGIGLWYKMQERIDSKAAVLRAMLDEQAAIARRQTDDAAAQLRKSIELRDETWRSAMEGRDHAWRGSLDNLAGSQIQEFKSLRAEVDECHHRINKTRDEMVRREDFMPLMDRLSADLNRLSGRIDFLISAPVSRGAAE